MCHAQGTHGVGAEVEGVISPSTVTLRQFSAKALAPLVALVTYWSTLRDANGNARYALRSSIWRRTEQGWRLVFHQGTPTAPAH